MIRTIQSNNYKGMDIDWTQDATWKCEYDPNRAKKATCEPRTEDEDIEEPKITPKIGKCLISFDENEL